MDNFSSSKIDPAYDFKALNKIHFNPKIVIAQLRFEASNKVLEFPAYVSRHHFASEGHTLADSS